MHYLESCYMSCGVRIYHELSPDPRMTFLNMTKVDQEKRDDSYSPRVASAFRMAYGKVYNAVAFILFSDKIDYRGDAFTEWLKKYNLGEVTKAATPGVNPNTNNLINVFIWKLPSGSDIELMYKRLKFKDGSEIKPSFMWNDYTNHGGIHPTEGQ